MRRTLVILLLIAVIGGGVVIANISRDPESYGINWPIKIPKSTKKVELAKPTRSTIVQTITAPGIIELVDQADIAPEVMGQVTAVNADRGDRVKKGDILIELDDSDAQARMDSVDARIERLKTAINSAEADLEKAIRDSQGFESLAAKGFSTPTEVADAQTLLAKMTASLAMSRFDLKEAEASRKANVEAVKNTKIEAPMDGVVIDREVEEGEVVIAGTTNLPGSVLMTIGDVDKKQVRADVDETDVSLVKASQPTLIFLQSDQETSLNGVVELVAPTGKKEGEVVSFETIVAIEGKQPTLRPGMTATLEIEVKRSANALCVPVQAVVSRRLKDLPDTEIFQNWAKEQKRGPGETDDDIQARFVPVIFVKDGKLARAKPVKTGISDKDRIEILAGLEEDVEVVVGPFRALDELKDETPIELLTEKDKAAGKGK